MKVFDICCIDSLTGAEMVLSECPGLSDALVWLACKTGKSGTAKLYKENIHKITVEGIGSIVFIYDEVRKYLMKGEASKWR